MEKASEDMAVGFYAFVGKLMNYISGTFCTTNVLHFLIRI